MKTEIDYFKKNGFVVLKNIIDKEQIKNLYKEIEVIKNKAFKTKNNRYYHLTKDKKINTIHNIQKFYKSKLLINLSKNTQIKKFLNNTLSKKISVRNYEFFKTCKDRFGRTFASR